jgi:putative lipoprotein
MIGFTAALAATVALVAAPGGPPPTPAGAAITGHVVLKPGDTLPAGAVVRVRLEVAAAPERAARRVAETAVEAPPPTGPIPFRIEYDASQIDSTKQYLVRATISAGGKTVFASRSTYPVLTHGAPARAEIQVEKSRSFRAGGTAAATLDARLSAAPWTLVSLGNALAIPGANGSPRLVFEAEKTRISGSTGCNSFFGTYALEDSGQIGLDPAGMTMMACAENLSKQEKAFVEALRATTGYRIAGAALELTDGSRVLARFESKGAAAGSD